MTKTATRNWPELRKLLPGYDPDEDKKGDIVQRDPETDEIVFEQHWDYKFDEERADHAIGFFPEFLHHVKGAKAREPFILEPWQEALIGNMFGWVDADGLRRYREIFVMVGKKNGKSAMAAGILLYVLYQDGEGGAECYSAASSAQQAEIIFSHAKGMVRQDPDLTAAFRVFGGSAAATRKAIEYEVEDSVYRCLASDADTVDGANVHMAVIDELHRHKSRELTEVLVNSTAARSQPIILYTTTSDYARPSLCNEKRDYAIKVRDGDVSDPNFLPAIFELQKTDDVNDESIWVRANPNLDVTLTKEYLRRRLKIAHEVPTEMANFLRLHMNIRTDAVETWLQTDRWDECLGDIDVRLPGGRAELEETLVGKPCYVGVDLASTDDIAAVVCMFPQDDMRVVLGYYFIPAENARLREHRDRVPYSVWNQQGHISMTGEDAIDFEVIHAKIIALGRKYDVRQVVVDPWNAKQLSMQLQNEDGFSVCEMRQGFKDMNGPCKELERCLAAGEIAHGGDPVLRWMAGNTVVQRDGEGNIRPSKKKSTEKIDGIVALIMAIGAQLAGGVVDSPYNSRGFTVI